jgi:uncharacterized protein
MTRKSDSIPSPRRQTPGRWIASAGLLSAAALSASTLAGGCRFTDSAPHGSNYDRHAMLASIGEHAILATYGGFQASTKTLKTATAALVDALEATPADADAVADARSNAQAAWRAAMAFWQRAEVFGVGPSGLPEGEDGGVIGGQAVREAVYSWPIVNPCRVDQEIVSKDYESTEFPNGETTNVYGLDALEYLLFVAPDADNACAPQNAINTPGTGGLPSPWEEVTDVAQRRAAYADRVAAHLERVATDLYDAWAPTGAHFLANFSDAGRDGSEYGTIESAIEELLTGLFYIEAIKDSKLGEPAGLRPEGLCSSTCPDKLESRWAHASKTHIVENLNGFQSLFYGGLPAEDNEGLDDFLLARGADGVVSDYAEKHAAVLTALALVPGTLEEALTATPAAVSNLHTAVSELALTVGEIATALKIDLAIVPGGDGD